MSLTPQRLRELLTYDPLTGFFIRKVSRGCSGKGLITGTPTKKGYLRFKVDGKKFMAHRLAWLYMYGVWPTEQLDHRDGNKLNNTIENLRDVVQVVNQHNRWIARVDNKTGLQGVGQLGRKFRARITIDGKVKHIGVFNTAGGAHQAYLTAKETV